MPMESKEVVSFPQLGNYYVPITFLLKRLLKKEVKMAPPMSKKTIDLGSKYSPDSVCIPFKYNLGNFIETLDQGATILVQAGGGCRYGYYAEVQEQILKDLGYHFKFYTLLDQRHFAPWYLYRTLRKIEPHLSFPKYAYYTLLALKMVQDMDQIDHYVRAHIGFETTEGSFEKLQQEMLTQLSKVHTFLGLHRCYKKYQRKFRNLPFQKPEHCLKVGIIGELYTSMEPFSNYFLEKQLAKMQIEVRRFTDLTYLLFQKRYQERKLLRKIPDYCRYTIGADGMDNVARCKILADEGYDGVIHIKPFGCTPEIGAMPIIAKVCEKEQLPIIYFSFDSNTSEVGIQTRLEAFYDMLVMRKEKSK